MEEIKHRKIPKTIHYCWFGNAEKPSIVTRCINSWKEKLPDYNIVEWNENNFDIHSNLYVSNAYKANKFAFVSDYVRVYTLFHYGGIYLDTDVEVLKSFDDLLIHDSFWGFEQENFIATSTIGSARGNPLIKEFLDKYATKNFIKSDGTMNDITNVKLITEILKNKGLKLNGEFQEIKGIGTFYPQTFFSPYDYINCRKFFTDNTYAIHYFYKSWLSPRARIKDVVKKISAKVIGGNNIAKIRKLVLEKPKKNN